MESRAIPDSRITASSFEENDEFDRQPKFARLGGERYWGSIYEDLEPWIQVELGSSHMVTELQTEGNYNSDEWQYWVQQLKVQVGMSKGDLMYIEDGDGQPQVNNNTFFTIKRFIITWVSHLPKK